MDEIADKLVAQVGLDRMTAHKVIEFLRQHADEVVASLQVRPGLEDTLSGALGDTVPGHLGGKF